MENFKEINANDITRIFYRLCKLSKYYDKITSNNSTLLSLTSTIIQQTAPKMKNVLICSADKISNVIMYV